MARLWHLMLLCWTWCPLILSSRVSIIGTPRECAKANFVPGYNLAGEGFNIVTMERKGAYIINTETWRLKGNGSCRLYINSNMNNEKQKVPASVVDWKVLPKCSLRVSSKLFDSVETLISDSISSVSNDWKVGLNIGGTSKFGPIYGASHSKEATFGMQKSKQDRYGFSRHSVSCDFYRYRLVTNPPLSNHFKAAVNSLGAYSPSTQASYRSLIDTYGTHYITQVTLGGEMKAITSIKICAASMDGLTLTEVNDCLSVEASASFNPSANIKSMRQYCQDKSKIFPRRSFSSMFHERRTEVTGGNINGADILFEGQSNPSIYNRWIKSLKTIPGVVRYNIMSLHTILPAGHTARAGLKQEVEKYIRKNAIVKKCSENCKIGHRSSSRDPCACVCSSNQLIRSNCCPAGRGLATLKVFGLYAKGLYGDVWTQTDGSVEVRYGKQITRTAIIANNDNPKWSEIFYFGPINLNKENKILFSVYDEDTYWISDSLGNCTINLRSGHRRSSCMLNHGTFFFSYIVECAPSLGGGYCNDYIATTMSSSLATSFYTRNVVLDEEPRLHNASQPASQADFSW